MQTYKCLSSLRNTIFAWRSFIILMCFLCISLHAVMRNVLNVSSVCMLVRNKTSSSSPTNVTIIDFIPKNNKKSATSVRNDVSSNANYSSGSVCHLTPNEELQYEGNLVWSQKEVDFVMATLGWGRFIAVFPSGYLADKFSSSHMLLGSMLLASLSTLLMPPAAVYSGYIATMVLRFALGLTIGMVQPCITALIAQWCPEKELSSRLIFVMSGLQLTVFVLNPIVAQYCSWKHIWGGWPLGFFSAGILGLSWCLVWYFTATNFPEQHSRISKKELARIADYRGFRMEEKSSENITLKSYPWRSAILSRASIACLISDVSGTFGVFCVLYYFPRYLRDVVVLDLKTNGLVAGLPNLLQFICKLSFSALADFFKNTLKFGKTPVVKAFNTFGLCSLAILLFSATFITCEHPWLAVLCVVLSKATFAATGPGFIASEVLIAPKYAGFLCGWFNFIATLSQVILPYLVAFIVTDSHSAAQWRTVFGIGSCMQIFGALVFLFWGSGEEQEWAKSNYSNSKVESMDFDGKSRVIVNDFHDETLPLGGPTENNSMKISGNIQENESKS